MSAFTFDTFEDHIDSTILGRGSDILTDGGIISVEQIDSGAWVAQVQGSVLYQVEISEGKSGELITSCTCPYDWGPTCKHEAAVLYAIKEAPEPQAAQPTRIEQLRTILDGTSHADLTDTLITLAHRKPDLLDTLLLTLKPEGPDKATAKRRIKEALNAGGERSGFIDYYGSRVAAQGVAEVQQQAIDYLAKGQYTHALPITQAIIEELGRAIAHADDSDGTLGDCMRFALEHLEIIGKNLSSEERADLLAYCLKEAVKKKYDGWDWQWGLAYVAGHLVETKTERKKLDKVLDTFLERKKGGWTEDFSKIRVALIRADVIERLEGDAALVVFLHPLRKAIDIRLRLIAHHTERGNLDDAQTLIDEGLRETDNRNYVRALNVAGLEVAQKRNDTGEIIRLARALLRQGYTMTYYDILKEHVTEWEQFVLALLKEVDMPLKREIYVREGMWRQLLNSLQPDEGYAIQHYREHLEGRFPSEMADLYERHIADTLEQRADRKNYRRVCGLLKRMHGFGAGSQAERVAAELRERYPRRSALHDELDKMHKRLKK